MKTALIEKAKESLASILPITFIVIILSFFFGPINLWQYIGFLIGAIMLIIGMTFFTLGADLSMTPVGNSLGSYLTKQRKLWLLLVVSGAIGFLITIAEPDLLALSSQFDVVPPVILILVVALGVGIFLMFSMLRIVLQIPLSKVFMVCYIIVFGVALILQLTGKETFLPIAFDSGGVTTGPMTVPFILALGYGVSSVRGGENSQDDSFGLVALCSIGPVLAVMILGLFAEGDINTAETVTVLNSFNDFIKHFGHTLGEVIIEVIMALSAIVVFIVIYEFIVLKENKKHIIKIMIGLIYTFIGLVFFLTGAKIGYMPLGSFFGKAIASIDFNWIIIPISMIMGFFVVMAEPAVHVLNKQVEEVSSGTISKKVMLFTLAIGVSISLGLAMLRIICDFSIWWIVLPGYLIALLLSLYTPKMFTAIAFDSGGVASGPMTATFILPFATGACAAVSSGSAQAIMLNGFGVVALVAMTPLIVVQVIGAIYKYKLNKAVVETEYEYEDIIEFVIDEQILKECSNESN